MRSALLLLLGLTALHHCVAVHNGKVVAADAR
jgi:hypothetical protein